MATAYPEARRHQGVVLATTGDHPRLAAGSILVGACGASESNFLDKSSIDIVNAMAPTSAGAQLM